MAQNADKKPIVTYEIWAEMDDQNRSLKGRETIEWTNTSADQVPDIWFHLYWNAFKNDHSTSMMEVREADDKGARFRKKLKPSDRGWINVKSIRTGTGADITHTMEFMQVDEPIRPYDQTVMRVALPEPLRPGETITLNLVFELKIPRSVARSGYYHNSFFFGQWYPKPGVYEEGKGWNCHHYHQSSEFFSDFASFTVHMTVPSSFVVGSSGKEINKTVKENHTTYTFSQDRIHDFAWVADPDFIKIERNFVANDWISKEETTEMARLFQLPMDEIRLPDIQMILLINPEHRSQVERHFTALAQAIKYYGLWYGPYPYETITLVDPPYRNDCGGMEYPTLITGETMVVPSQSPMFPDMVIIHEFGHNYWYGLNANNEFEEAWLDEGINSYSDGKVLAKIYGPYALPMYFNGIPMDRYFKHITIDKYEMDRMGALGVLKTDPIVTNSWEFDSPGSYGRNVYMRAATCLHTLERILGEETMMRILRTFHNRFRFKHPVTADFIRVVNDISRKDMNWFFEEFFFKANEFDYAVGSVKILKELPPPGSDDPEKKSYISIVKIRRLGEARLGGDVKLDILITFEDDSKKTVYWDGQDRWKAFRFTTPSKIKTVQVDPMNRFLIDANLTNNSYRKKADKTASRKIGSKILFYFQNLFQAISIFS